MNNNRENYHFRTSHRVHSMSIQIQYEDKKVRSIAVEE